MSKKLDLFITILLPLLSGFLSLFLKLNYLSSTILMFAPPSLWLLLRQNRQFKKISIFTALLSLPFTLMLDYLITKDLGWYIVKSSFPFRLYHIVPIEQFIWGFLYIFLLISFYEYFLDKKDKKKSWLTMPLMEPFSKLIAVITLIFIFAASLIPDLLSIPYAYAVLGIFLGIIPLTLFLFNFPNLARRFVQSIGYFGYLGLINEYVSLKLNHWTFPGTHFIGTTNFFGYTIPYEEVFIYFILLAPILLAYYEFFDDDRK